MKLRLIVVELILLGIRLMGWGMATPVEAQSGIVRFNGDFETGNLSQYRFVQACGSDRVTVYSHASRPDWPVPRQGTYAARFNVSNSDVYPCTPTENPRAQILSPNFINPGDEYWAAFSMYFPIDMPEIPSGGWVTLQSFYGEPGGNSGGAHLQMIRYKGTTSLYYEGNIGTTTTGWATPVVRGGWTDLLLHVRFSKASTVGFVELWYNGQPQVFPECDCTKLFKQTINNETTSLLHSKLLQYRQAGMWPGAVNIFFDGHRVGTTRAAVELVATRPMATNWEMWLVNWLGGLGDLNSDGKVNSLDWGKMIQ